MRKICLAILLVPQLAWAQQKTADEWYKEGANQYNLGNFDKAVEAFKQGFALEPDESKKPNYLYNIAQAYRLANDCKNALFFYRRFLALKANDPSKPIPPKTRKEIEDRIPELEACVQQQTSISKKPPTNNIPPDGDGDKTPPTDGDGRKDSRKEVATGGKRGDDEEDDGGSITKPVRLPRPHVISARLTGGGTKVNAGTIDVGVRFTAALVGGYPIAINDKLTIDAGAAFTFTPVNYTRTESMLAPNDTAQLIGLMANGAATYEVIPKLGLRGDLGIGALFFANVSESPFTDNAPTSGALSMFHLRVALSADYAFTPNIVGTLTPIAFSYSPPKEGLDPGIKSLTSIDFMLGIGYRM
jgi:hypothetical protein